MTPGTQGEETPPRTDHPEGEPHDPSKADATKRDAVDRALAWFVIVGLQTLLGVTTLVLALLLLGGWIGSSVGRLHRGTQPSLL
jgi:hypothetical protein